MHPIESRAVGSLSTCRPTRTMCQRLHVDNKPLSKPLVFSHEGPCNGKMDCFGVAMLLLSYDLTTKLRTRLYVDN
jgi:hypothetical protein